MMTVLNALNASCTSLLTWILRTRGGSLAISSARYLACCSEYKHSAEQVKFWHGLTTTIGLVNYQVSRNCLVANCCSDDKYVGGFADIFQNDNLIMSVGQNLSKYLPHFLNLHARKDSESFVLYKELW